MSARPRGVIRNASALLTMVALVAGCSGSADEPASAPDAVTPVPAASGAPPQPAAIDAVAGPTPEPEAAAAADPALEPEEAATAEPAPESADEATPLATAAGDLPGLTLEITALRRSSGDDSITLEFALRNDGDTDFEPRYDLGYGANNINDSGAVGGVYLVDVAGAKKYLVLRDADGVCLCSSGFSVPAGQRTPLFATFPPLPAETEAVTVTVPHFLPVDDVPVGE